MVLCVCVCVCSGVGHLESNFIELWMRPLETMQGKATYETKLIGLRKKKKKDRARSDNDKLRKWM